uniref:Uncharacterized protein n=1 Tax=Anguilla anguilla TaxID=7936 RepID=A0A0E9XR62_ANGAN
MRSLNHGQKNTEAMTGNFVTVRGTGRPCKNFLYVLFFI